MTTCQIDDILVGQKDFILDSIYRLAEYSALAKDTELNKSDRELARQLQERQQVIIKKMMMLVQPFWIINNYGYKYTELELLLNRATLINPDGTW